IQSKAVVLASRARNSYVLFGPAAPLTRAGLPSAGEAGDYIRTQRDELQEITPVQGQVYNTFVVDHGADGRAFRGQQGRTASNFHNLRKLTQLQCEINPCSLLHLQFYTRPGHSLEPLHSDAQRIKTRL